MLPRIGAALFNADHTRLGDELRRVEAAGIDFVHLDVFDGYLVPDQGFPARTISALRPLTALPFEVHLVAQEPLRFLPALAESGVNLVFLPAESTPLLYEAIFAVRELGMRAGLCLALGTPLQGLLEAIPLLDAVLLLGRVTGEGARGRAFNERVLARARAVRAAIDAGEAKVDLQVAGGLEPASCRAAVEAGATSLPLGAALHREADPAAYLRSLRATLTGDTVTAEARRRGDGAEDSTTEGATPAGIAAPQLQAPPGAGAVAAPPASPSITSPAVGATTISSLASFSASSPRLRVSAVNVPSPWRVLVASRSFGKNCPEVVDELRAAGCELIPNRYDRAPSEEELIAQVGAIDALISGTEPVTARVLDAAPRLKVISKHGVGYENIDLAAAEARGVVVAIAAGAIEDSVADLTMALLLGLARGLPEGVAAVRAGGWPRIVGMELRGKTLGIVGLGAIGKGVCARATAFGMRVIAFDVRQDAAFAARHGVEYVALEELLRRADVVTLHAPVLPSTRGMIDAARLALMKPGAYLINTARGELVDEAALADALRRGALAGAGLDVFVREPPGEDNPLLGLRNVLAMPHSAGQTHEGLRRMGEITAENLLRVLRGQPPLHAVHAGGAASDPGRQHGGG